MTNTELFIQKAVEGGYKGRGIATDGSWWGASVLLIPEVWKAVSKVEGWECRVEKELCLEARAYLYDEGKTTCWHGHIHRMVDFICNGTSIEDYLGSILTK